MKTDKLKRLKNYIASFPRVVIAFSGGVDSSLLLRVCRDTLGADRVTACTGISPLVPRNDITRAKRFARSLKVNHILLHTREFADDRFTANPPTRCYLCKTALFKQAWEYASAHGIQAVFDGSNFDDLGDYRPGLTACRENNVKSPLAEARITKNEIRRYSRELGLADWDRPAGPCLASRIPYGQTITTKKLRRIEQAERFLKNLGFSPVRVRDHGDLARIEVAQARIPEALEYGTREKILQYLKKLGYIWVCTDLDGFKSGSLNRGIT
jgi:uncharacterized protein